MTILYWLVAAVLVAALAILAVKGGKRAKDGSKFTPAEIAEAGIAVALAIVLGFVKVMKMPQGGAVSIDMIPIFYIAMRRGAPLGFMAGLVFGFAKLLTDPYVVHPVQLILDYPLPFAMLGLAGLFGRRRWLGVLVGGFGRFVCHVLSGVIFFASYAGDQNVLVYSMAYNASYLVPELIIAIVVIMILSSAYPALFSRKR